MDWRWGMQERVSRKTKGLYNGGGWWYHDWEEEQVLGGRNYCSGTLGWQGLWGTNTVVRSAGVWTEDKSRGVSMSVSKAMARSDCPEEWEGRGQGTPAPRYVVDEEEAEEGKGKKVPQDKREDSRTWHYRDIVEGGSGPRWCCCWRVKWEEAWEAPRGRPKGVRVTSPEAASVQWWDQEPDGADLASPNRTLLCWLPWPQGQSSEGHLWSWTQSAIGSLKVLIKAPTLWMFALTKVWMFLLQPWMGSFRGIGRN